MEKMLKICGLLSFFLFVAGCRGNKNEQLLDLAEACIESHPDSASVILQKVDDVDYLSDSQLAKFSLLWTQMQHKCHLQFGNDSLIDIAINYYMKVNDKHRTAKALFYRGLIHKQCKDVEKAVESFALSEHWFEGVEDDKYKALLYNYYGALMYEQGNYEQALHYYKKTLCHELKGDSIHYTVSTYSHIANVCKLLGLMDSARYYYEEGLSYRNCIPDRYYYTLMHNYANFLVQNEEYIEAEKIILECMTEVSDSLSLYKVYSSLATLYCDKGEYANALMYAERMLESSDSLMLRGGHLHLYKIYSEMGDTDKAEHHHLKYSQYHSDITMRLKTKEVSVIPYKVERQILVAKNQKDRRILCILLGGISVLLVTSGYASYYFRKRNKKKVFERNLEIGKLNSKITRKEKKINRQKDELQRERDKIKEKNEEIEQLKETENLIRKEKQELEKVLASTQKEQREIQAELEKAEHDKRIDKRIALYRTNRKVDNIATLLTQLKYGGTHVEKPIAEADHLPMLVALLDAELPGMRQQIDALTNNRTKQVLCYLIALGLDDTTIMFRITDKRENTIKKYYKECRELVDGLKGSDLNSL